jgi:malonate decarboxylase epsilon subunit
MHAALLFPGQGAQRPGFLHRLPAHPLVRVTLDEAAAALARDIGSLDDPVSLRETGAVQLATVIAGVASARALAAEGLLAQAVAGLSVGAFTAAVTCGVLGFPDALRLVAMRGEAMARAAPHGYGMTAILGMGERDVRALVARVSERVPLYLASVNAPGEVVVSGSEAALAAAAEAAQALGASAQRLNVSIPSHCPLMEEVSQELRAALAEVSLSPPRLAYVNNHRARIAANAADVAEDLIFNVSRTVRWHDSMTLLHELGYRLFIETPPGHVLTDLVGATLPNVRTVALDEAPLATAVILARRAPGA